LKTEYLTQPRKIANNSAVAVGSFDGLHLGHRAILDKLKSCAKELDGPSVVLTFNPHPKNIVGSGETMKLLSPLEEKVPAIAALGVDLLVVVAFDEKFAALTAEEFVRNFLVDSLGVAVLVIGTDHGFGKDREGNLASLELLSKNTGFVLNIVEPVLWDDKPIKSRRIREVVVAGDMPKAAHMLGRPYTIVGEVVPGRGRGRKLGFPTANLKTPPEKLLPKSGIYAVSDEQGKLGLMYIGTSPTFGEGEFTVEFYRLESADYKKGETIRLSVFQRIRGEAVFPGSGELIKQMESDRTNLIRWAEDSGIKFAER